jgi:hypothetical protein
MLLGEKPACVQYVNMNKQNMFAADMRVLSDNEGKYSSWTLSQHFELASMLTLCMNVLCCQVYFIQDKLQITNH